MKTIANTTLRTVALWLCLLLFAGCVTAVDDALPYTRLPEITIASPVRLTASPSHPTSYLSSDSIPAGSKVQVIGADENMAWLLVLHGETLGWMPAFIAGTGIATLTPAVVFEPLDGECTEYLGATFDANEVWTSTSRGDLYVLGSIYRPRTGTRFDDASLAIQLSGGGAVVDSDYLHTALTRNNAVIFFAYSVRDAQRNSQISFDASGLGGEDVVFQSLFFSNTCTASKYHLPIGIAKAATQDEAITVAPDPVQPEQSNISPTTIVRESGPPTSVGIVVFDASTLTLSNGRVVSTWGGQASSGTPTYFTDQTPNGGPAVAFNGDDRMANDVSLAPSTVGDWILVAVIRPINTGKYHNIVEDNPENRPMLWIDPGFNYELNYGGGTGAKSAGMGTDGWDIVIADSRLNQLYVNSPTPNATGKTAVSFTSTKPFDFFHRDGGQTFQGWVAELRIYNNRADFSGDFAALYNEMRGKWFDSP